MKIFYPTCFLGILQIVTYLLIWSGCSNSIKAQNNYNAQLNESLKCNLEFACDPTSFGNGCQQNKTKFIIFGNDGSGIGNQLVFFPAVYAFAITQGRQILLEDDTVIANLCKLLEFCFFRTVKNATLQYPQIKNAINHPVHLKVKDFIEWSKGSKSNSNKLVVKASGYKEDISWWTNNKSFVDCIAKFSNCCKNCFSCTARESLNILLPGWLKKSYIERFAQFRSFPTTENSRPPIFDVGIHLRNQLHYFEMNANPNSSLSEKASAEYISSNQTLKLFKNLVKRLQAQVPLNSSVYISSDNEYVKQNLTEILQSLGYKVYRVLSDGIVHSKSSAILSKLTSKKGYHDTLVDWKCISNSNILLVWRDVRPKFAIRFISTFAKSAKLSNESHNAFVLIDPNKIDSSSKNWKHF